VAGVAAGVEEVRRMLAAMSTAPPPGSQGDNEFEGEAGTLVEVLKTEALPDLKTIAGGYDWGTAPGRLFARVVPGTCIPSQAGGSTVAPVEAGTTCYAWPLMCRPVPQHGLRPGRDAPACGVLQPGLHQPGGGVGAPA
jgi:hypothetical protein